MKVETFILNGIIFRRYPHSDNWADRNYFRPNGTHIKRGIEALHRELWKAAHGPIPRGYDVHHKDGDTSHNVIENLECIPAIEHQRNHEYTKSDEYKARRRDNLDRQRDKANAWHASDAGHEWHSQNSSWVWKVRKTHRVRCAYCGNTFETKDTKQSTRFCSNNCKAYARRVSGVDNEDRACAWCGKTFTVNKYSKTQCCSNSCAAYLRNSRQ